MLLPILAVSAVLGVNAYVKVVGGSYIISPEEAVKLSDVDCIIVLGCKVKDSGDPSDMLADRLKRGIDLYKQGAAPKIIMSGDHGTVEYDEVNTMKRIAIDAGIPSSDVFMDHAGFSTYESIYRAKEIFEADKIIIVTQEYHLYRALYIAEKLGIEAYGVNSDYNTYWGQIKRDIREILARCKDFVSMIFMPEPTYLGEKIPISGNGDLTND
jgi:vancomycin permeability regulator SanA